METPVLNGKYLSTYENYQGKYIATTEYCCEKIIASASTGEQARNIAIQKGYPKPVVVYIAEDMSSNIF